MPYYNIDGSKRESLSLEPGDELLVRDEDIYGKTLLHDPNQNKPSLYLGLGKVVIPEHTDLSDEERAELGYEYHLGRPDFEAIRPLEDILSERKKAAKKKKAQKVPQTVTIEQPSEDASDEDEDEDATVEASQTESEQS
jgi:hypothetical protein